MGEFSVIPDSRFTIGSMGFFRSLKETERYPSPFDLYRSSPFFTASMPNDALIPRSVTAWLWRVASIFLVGTYPDVVSLIIKAIMIYMVTQNSWISYAQYKPVHPVAFTLPVDCWGVCSRIKSLGIFSKISKPLILAHKIKVFIVYERHLALGQRDFNHAMLLRQSLEEVYGSLQGTGVRKRSYPYFASVA